MTAHTCRAIVVSCMDFRLGKYIGTWADKNIGVNNYDRLSLAGAVKNLPFVMEQISLSVKLHGIKEAYLVNHEDCGAYGAAGTLEKHTEDLLAAKKEIESKFPDLTAHTLYLKLDGEYVKVR